MADVKDILGVSRSGGGPKEPAAPAPKKDKLKRPEGMSREAFALLAGGLHPIAPTQLAEHVRKVDLKAMKGKRASSRGVVTYQWRTFTNPGRQDGLQLSHWVKCYKDRTGEVTPADKGEYHFAKYNTKPLVMRFDDEEWESLIDKSGANPADAGWTREETQHLLDVADAFNLKWVAIADRYEWQGRPRPVEELKARYYSIARQLLVGREGGEPHCANHPLVKHPYSLQYEADRKKGLRLLMARSAKQDAEEDVILEQAKQIEARRRAVQATRRPSGGAAGASSGGGGGGPSRKGSAATSVLEELSAAVGSGGAWDSAGAGVAGGAAGGIGGTLMVVGAAPAAVGSMEFTQPGVGPPPGQCGLLTAEVTPFQPPAPGVYARGVHCRDVGQSQLQKVPGGPRAQKLVESTVSELGVPDVPRMPTRAVCGAWLSLRNEVVAMLTLKRQLQHRQGNDPGAAGLGPRKKSKSGR